jgi:DNA-binding beta-propeller fold protein YncE
MEVFCNSCGGYGGLIDRNQVMWSADREPFGLLRYNTHTQSQQCLTAYGSYGLGIDSRGNIRNANFEQNKVRKFRASGILAGEYPIGRDARGVVVTPKDDNVWIANSNSASVTRVNSCGTVVKYISTGTTPIGVSVDFNGKVWVINYSSNSMSRINPDISNGVVDLTVNLPSGALPYNYNDMA